MSPGVGEQALSRGWCDALPVTQEEAPLPPGPGGQVLPHTVPAQRAGFSICLEKSLEVFLFL